MEPVIALNQAAAIVNFLNFSTALLNDQKATHRRGRPLKFKDFDQAISEVLSHIESLNTASSATKDDKCLTKITLDCINIGQQLVHGLQCLTLSRQEQPGLNTVGPAARNAARSKWSTFRDGLRTIWTAEHDATLTFRLTSIRQELASHLLTLLGPTLDTQSASVTHSHITGAIAFLNNHHFTIITTLENGETHTTISRHETEPGQLSTQAIHITCPADQPEPTILLRPLDTETLNNTILKGLSFLYIMDHDDTVLEAHKETFNRIFQQTPSPKLDTSKSWTDFPKWLENESDSDNGQGIYWINGEAGSGKSTLMKFILGDARTWFHLETWATSSSLVSASFLFSDRGTRRQKTHQGLLRSLLHDVLKKKPELVPVVMPELVSQCATATSQKLPMHEPDFLQLQTWFKRLVNQASETCRLFFQIDGIDEYEGDVNDLISLITASSSSSRHIKFLISSRRIPACFGNFASAPGLQLHEINKDDMIAYCNSKIGKQLAKVDQDYANIIDEIVHKSSGVFLWMILAVNSIQNGLRSQNQNLESLRTKLDEMPTDLTELYIHAMKNAIPNEFRSEASRIFQLLQHSQGVEREIRGNPGLLAIQLAFALKSEEEAASVDPQVVTRQQEKRMIRNVRELLLTRCSGLLDLQTRRQIHSGDGGDQGKRRKKKVKSLAAHVLSAGSNPTRPHLGFIHRTVEVFMRDAKVRAEMMSWSPSTPGSIYHALFESCITMVKRFPTSEVVHPRGSVVWETAYTGMRYAQLAEQSGEPISMARLSEFDEVLTRHWNKAQVYLADSSQYESTQDKHWSSIFFQLTDGITPDGGPTWTHNIRSNRDNGFRSLDTCSKEDYDMAQSTMTQELGFIRVAIVYGLGSYIHAKLTSANTKAALVTSTLKFWRSLIMSSFPLRLKVPAGISLPLNLLQTGIILGTGSGTSIDANNSFTLWNIFLMELSSARDMKKMSDEQARQFPNLVREYFNLSCVTEYMAGQVTIGSGGGFGRLLLQLGAILKSNQPLRPASEPGLFEAMHRVVMTLEAKFKPEKCVGNSEEITQLKVVVPNKPLGRGSNLKGNFSPDTPTSNTESNRSGSVSESSTKNNTDNSPITTPGNSSTSSLVKPGFGIGSIKELATTWSLSIQPKKSMGEFSGKKVLHLVKTGTKRLKLPMAKKRAIWREWDVVGVQTIHG